MWQNNCGDGPNQVTKRLTMNKTYKQKHAEWLKETFTQYDPDIHLGAEVFATWLDSQQPEEPKECEHIALHMNGNCQFCPYKFPTHPELPEPLEDGLPVGKRFEDYTWAELVRGVVKIRNKQKEIIKYLHEQQ